MTYTPEADYNGDDSFSFKANDGTVDSDPATVNITVRDIEEPNQSPIATFTTFTMDEDTTYNGTLTATDPESDVLTFAKVADPSEGTVTVDANGNFTYVPTANYNGSDSFSFTVNDGVNAPVLQVVSITITDIAEPNQSPTATFTTFTMDEDTTYNGILTATDPENNSLTFTKVADPSEGTLIVNANGNFTYVPTANYYGNDSFTYSVSDGTNGAVSQVVTVNVSDVAEPDTTPPVIALTGASTITLSVGDSYTELGATANDDIDGVVSVVITGVVDTSTA